MFAVTVVVIVVVVVLVAVVLGVVRSASSFGVGCSVGRSVGRSATSTTVGHGNGVHRSVATQNVLYIFKHDFQFLIYAFIFLVVCSISYICV